MRIKLFKLKRKRLACAIGILAGLHGLQAPQAVAQTLNGSWTGSGFVKPTSGQREKVRCRVRYSKQSAKVYGVSARCASASTTLNQTGELLKVRPNLFVGDFYNAQFDFRGRIRVVISGKSQRVTLSGDGASGSLRLRKR